MAGLPNRTAANTVEDAILLAINLALRERRYTTASVAALRAVVTVGASSTQSVAEGVLAVVTGTGLYQWSQSSTAADNGTTVIKPTDAGSTGRWLKQANPGGTDTPLMLRGVDVTAITSGYLRNVALYEGGFGDPDFEGTIFGQRPAVLVDLISVPKKQMGTQPGALNQCDFKFYLWVVDFNARGRLTATRGSTVAAEQTRSPGCNAIMGDLDDLLDGVLGEQLGETGIGFAHTGDRTLLDKTLADHGRIIWQVELGVWATTGKTDEDVIEDAEIYAQPQIAIARPADEDVDPDNAIVSGLVVSVGLGFNAAPSDGSAVLDGATVTVAGAAVHTFDPWVDTYRDLADDGTFTYTAVAIGADAPTQGADTLRVGYTRTDGSGITEDVLLAPTLRDDGDPFLISA